MSAQAVMNTDDAAWPAPLTDSNLEHWCWWFCSDRLKHCILNLAQPTRRRWSVEVVPRIRGLGVSSLGNFHKLLSADQSSPAFYNFGITEKSIKKKSGQPHPKNAISRKKEHCNLSRTAIVGQSITNSHKMSTFSCMWLMFSSVPACSSVFAKTHNWYECWDARLDRCQVRWSFFFRGAPSPESQADDMPASNRSHGIRRNNA